MDSATQLQQFKTAWKRSMSTKVKRCLTTIKCFGKLEIVELCPSFLYDDLIELWQQYTPLKRKSNYNRYYTTKCSATFYKSLAGITFFRKVKSTFLIATVSEQTPAFALFSEKLQSLVLVFSYSPTDESKRWPSRIRPGKKGALRNIRKHQMYLQQK